VSVAQPFVEDDEHDTDRVGDSSGKRHHNPALGRCVNRAAEVAGVDVPGLPAIEASTLAARLKVAHAEKA
jgi:hypothetical protein